MPLVAPLGWLCCDCRAVAAGRGRRQRNGRARHAVSGSGLSARQIESHTHLLWVLAQNERPR
eukprot:6201491-Pleurochrysis_carterae.AAC.2